MDIGFLITLYREHPEVFYVAAGLWLFNALIQKLPEPDLVAPSKFYVWFYNTVHWIGANIELVKKESYRRQVVKEKIDSVGDGTVTEKKHAVEDAKAQLKKEASIRLDEQASVSKLSSV